MVGRGVKMAVSSVNARRIASVVTSYRSDVLTPKPQVIEPSTCVTYPARSLAGMNDAVDAARGMEVFDSINAPVSANIWRSDRLAGLLDFARAGETRWSAPPSK